MCTLLFSFKQHQQFPLLLAANRDEFHARPTRTLHWWEDHPHVLGGRDEQEGGTWFGITRSGRFATLTNYRSFPQNPEAPSRGHLVSDFLLGSMQPSEYLQILQSKGSLYNGFNLLFGSPDDLWYYSNRSGFSGPLGPGLYGLSNALLNDPWPKVVQSKIEFDHLFQIPHQLPPAAVFDALANRQQYPDELLPHTGVGLERERVLSSLFIESPGYGTRASWFLRAEAGGKTEVFEQSYLPVSQSQEQFHRETSFGL